GIWHWGCYAQVRRRSDSMTRCFALLAGLMVAWPSVAFAQGSCPDGDWFCDSESAEPSDASDASEAPAEPEEAKPEKSDAKPKKGGEGPPVVVSTPPGERPSHIIVVDKPEDAPKPPRHRWHREWGFNLHIDGAILGDRRGKASDAGMG